MLTHDQAVELARTAVAALSCAEVATAFAASLTTRNLAWRSALGSMAAMQHVAPHAFEPSRLNQGNVCAVCGLPRDVRRDEAALAELRAKQHRLVRFYDIVYAGHDLATFRALAPAEPTAADRRALGDLLDRLRALGPDARIGDLERALRKRFPSNKNERKYMLEALAIAGILRTPTVPSFGDRWVGFDERECDLVPRHFYARDSSYPLQHWAGDGLDEDAVDRWFGELLPA